jgi:hypothetical protein
LAYSCLTLLLQIPLFAASSVTLAWDASPDASVTGYRIYYGPATASYTNSASLGNVTNATLTNLVAGTTYFIAATALDAIGLESDFSNETTYTVPTTSTNQPPSIVSQPASQTVVVGGNVSFSVTASGTGPLSYQWRRNGANLAGATSATLSLTGVTTNQAGNYRVVVNNLVGTATSSAAVLTVALLPVTSNTAPVLAAVADRIIHSGTLLMITNVASDTDVPANAFTFSLNAGAPTAASIGAADGIFAWPTTDADANTTNQISVRVTDNGVPPLSSVRSFVVRVVPRPLLTSLTVSNQIVNVAWTALVGQAYRLQFTTNLFTPNWIAMSPDVTAESATATHTNAFDPAVKKFYRVQVLP